MPVHLLSLIARVFVLVRACILLRTPAMNRPCSRSFLILLPYFHNPFCPPHPLHIIHNQTHYLLRTPSIIPPSSRYTPSFIPQNLETEIQSMERLLKPIEARTSYKSSRSSSPGLGDRCINAFETERARKRIPNTHRRKYVVTEWRYYVDERIWDVVNRQPFSGMKNSLEHRFVDEEFFEVI